MSLCVGGSERESSARTSSNLVKHVVSVSECERSVYYSVGMSASVSLIAGESDIGDSYGDPNGDSDGDSEAETSEPFETSSQSEAPSLSHQTQRLTLSAREPAFGWV